MSMTDPRLEELYPQYEIHVRWTYGEDSKTNGVQMHRMYRDDPGVDGVRRWVIEEWWPSFEKKGERPSEPDVQVTEQTPESWCLGWFNHWTFDVGQTDDEALASFEAYVRRYEDIQDRHPGDIPEGYRCLMGAEDRWRWNGEPDRSAAPCRCEHCREQGVIRVNH